MDFSKLVDLYYAKVFYHCIKIMKNEHDAADITQNTFTKVFMAIDNLKNAESFGAWIFTICNNEIKMFFRSKNCKQALNFSENEHSINCNKQYNRLYWAIDSLNEKHRDLILFKYFAEFTMKEIALLTCLDEKIIKSRLYEARKKLKTFLSDESMITNYQNRNRRNKIMSVTKLLDMGSQIIPRMSNLRQKELLKCAIDNKKFSEGIISELSSIENGKEFILECGGKISYEEFIPILACCDEATLYRINGQNYKTWRSGGKTKLLEDISKYMNTGGYIDSVETIMYVPSIIDTVAWYKKYLGWGGDGEECDREACYTQIRAYTNDVAQIMSSTFKGFHLRPSENKERITNCSCFIFVTNIENLRQKILDNGWDKVSEIGVPGWGTKQFILEDLNGFIIEFSEWICL